MSDAYRHRINPPADVQARSVKIKSAESPEPPIPNRT